MTDYRWQATDGVTLGGGAGDLYARALSAWEEDRDADILPEVERALPASNDFRLWHLHGLMQRRADRHDLALPSLERAVALKPDGFNQAFSLAQTLYEAGDPRAIDAYGRALRLSPGNPDVIDGLTMAFVANGEVETALTGLERIVGRSPEWVRGQRLLSDLRWAEGERAGFTRNFDAAIAERPQNIELRFEQLMALMHAEQWDDALAAIEAGRAAMGDLAIFAANEAVIHAERGDIALADRLFGPIADGTDSRMQVRFIRHLLRAGRPDEAAAAIEPWLGTDDAFMFWPYASLAWRDTDPARWRWLEGDPAFIGVYDLADRLPPLDQLADKLRSLHNLSGQPLEQSLRGGSQTDGDLFKRTDPMLVAVRETIRAAVAEHVATLPPPDPTHPLLSARRDRIAFNGSWSVRLRSSGFHSNHVHPMGWLSSALYIALPGDIGRDGAGMLAFGDPRSSCFDVDYPAYRTVEPVPGRLALFPSYVWHGTRPFNDGERLTIAFDIARFS